MDLFRRPLEVSTADADAASAAERLREVRETQLADLNAAKEAAEQAACNAAREQLADAAGVTIEGHASQGEHGDGSGIKLEGIMKSGLY